MQITLSLNTLKDLLGQVYDEGFDNGVLCSDYNSDLDEDKERCKVLESIMMIMETCIAVPQLKR